MVPGVTGAILGVTGAILGVTGAILGATGTIPGEPQTGASEAAAMVAAAVWQIADAGRLGAFFEAEGVGAGRFGPRVEALDLQPEALVFQPEALYAKPELFFSGPALFFIEPKAIGLGLDASLAEEISIESGPMAIDLEKIPQARRAKLAGAMAALAPVAA